MKLKKGERLLIGSIHKRIAMSRTMSKNLHYLQPQIHMDVGKHVFVMDIEGDYVKVYIEGI